VNVRQKFAALVLHFGNYFSLLAANLLAIGRSTEAGTGRTGPLKSIRTAQQKDAPYPQGK
jgi:hypothetical protein